MELYISNLEVLYLDKYKTVKDYLCDIKGAEVNPDFNGMFEAYKKKSSQDSRDLGLDSFKKYMYTIPISDNNIAEMSGDVVRKSLNGKSKENIKHLVYCHEFLNLPQPITVAMNIKRHGDLSQALPYAIKDQGSVVSLTAINIAKMFIEDNKQEFQIVCADKCNLPQVRVKHNQFPYGDGAASFTISRTTGQFKIVSWDLHSWHVREENNCEDELIVHIQEQLKHIKEENLNIMPYHVILQNFSSNFIDKIKLDCKGFYFYQREYRNTANLTTSDPYYSLKEMHQKGQIKKGMHILLIFAGSKGTIGTLHLECMQ
ncbi:hypothetical protein [Bacillus mycoides]|uniref:hypothetical protein n=1 Tax=Bacillus mycoides TaxID=1405 RepID=UPI001F09E6E3|nr:hypothetical protein [Bacillus mycoides]MED1287405.1 hypothetical protein [Bacillus mycoides]